MARRALVAVCFAASLSSVSALSGRLGQQLSIGAYRQDIEQTKQSQLQTQDVRPDLLYPEYNLSTPVDHFHNESQYAPHSNDSFPLRYWFDASYYEPGGPVIVLQGGETSGTNRLPFLQKGILAKLARATNGIGVVLEHRYYGTSFPTSDLSTENLRFLTTQQALADQAYFAQNIQFPGLDEYGDLTSESAPYIAYGGSYAGAFVAFLRLIYPDVYWGAISSSGVTKAIYNYWQYFEPVAEHAPQQCILTQKTLIHIVDNILIQKNHYLTSALKKAFGLGNLTHDDDFASVLAEGVSNWQELNWDPAVSSPEFYNYCNNLTAEEALYPATKPLRNIASHLIQQGGYPVNQTIVHAMLNFIGYVNLTSVSRNRHETADEYFGGRNATFHRQNDLAQWRWRSWSYQYCSEWGYLLTGDVPKDELPLISRSLTLEYTSTICREAFDIHKPSDVDNINKYGGYDLSYPRLAFIDGDWDPWKPATPHAAVAKKRPNTVTEPFMLIPNAVHHWDENSLFDNQTTTNFPPQAIKNVQSEELYFVSSWIREWQWQSRGHKAKEATGPQVPLDHSPGRQTGQEVLEVR